MSLDFTELKRTLQSLDTSRGAGKVFYVCPEGADEVYRSDFIGIDAVAGQVHATIPSALASCVSNRGDVVVVFPGTYTNSTTTLSLKGNVTLMGLPGRRDVTILKSGVQNEQPTEVVGFNTIDVAYPGCVIKDLTISNGWYNDGGKTRAGLWTNGQGTVISGCKFTFEGSAASAKHAVYVQASDVKMIDCHFEDVMSDSAIMWDSGAADIKNGLVKGCYFVGVNNGATKFALHTKDSANDYNQILVTENLFDAGGAGGAATGTWVDLSNGGAGDTAGTVVNNTFTMADVHNAAHVGAYDAGVLWVRNFDIAKMSTEAP